MVVAQTFMPDAAMAPEQAETPQIQAIVPEIVFGAPIAKIEPKIKPSEEIGEYIKPSLIRYPMYEYQTGTQFYLSKRQQIVVDAYLKTNNVAATVRALNEMHRKHGSPKRYSAKAVTLWLQKPLLARHVAQKQIDQGKVNWFDEKKWEAWGVDIMQGKVSATQVQVVIWKEFGKAKGWYKEPQAGGFMAQNMQINFTQSDGKA